MRATRIGHIHLACNARSSVESIMDMRQKLGVLISGPITLKYVFSLSLKLMLVTERLSSTLKTFLAEADTTDK